ncbi:MAG: alanine--tRNA ligase [Micavibrio sp.]|nr:MAG: alanine--tRNA ligase [Micavibrio sp.]
MMKTVNDIRSEFLNFFKGHGHSIVDSSPLVPQNDPTLMFVNSGMVQFKNVFTGAEKRDYTRATTAQKCVRAGGKHNDLDNVGYTARHHTFFEMMGNFSFGDYFKEEAIAFAWELVSKNFGMPKDKLLVTVHSTDEEAAELWKKIAGFPDDKIIRIPTDDNFWRMGDTGPCGPSSEIFYDHGDHIPGGPPGSPDEDGDRFIEIWNLVFMQFEQVDADTQINLPKPCIDTGMGLERMAATMMGSHDNYAIDIMRNLIEHSADLTSVDPDGEMSASHRVVADHLRCSAFLLADGVMPSNEGRGYVLRRIMRRGMRHAHLLGAKEPLMYRLLPTLTGMMGAAYPELKRAESMISETLKSEEERFKVTLERGLKMLDEESAQVKNKVLPGDVAFKLYDTFGFPLDLTQDALRAQGIEVDTDGFDTCMEEQKAQARAAWSGSGDAADEKIWFEILDECGPTEFLGYEVEAAEGQVLAIVKGGKRSDVLEIGEEGYVITNQTPFYAESGGQIGDRGKIRASNDVIGMLVQGTKKMVGKIHAHEVSFGNDSDEDLRVGDTVYLDVDHKMRTAIRANHSVTHLMHEALRRVLGEHVSQKGSLQDADRTRFDISHPKGMTPEEIQKVEAMVAEEIKAATPVETRLMGLEEARETGAMALFGEKYDDEVRVVMMGTTKGNRVFSIELCGGTHVENTGAIESFKIISEGALSAGVRRVEAMTGERAKAYEKNKAEGLEEVNDKLTAENKKLQSELVSLGGTVPDQIQTESAALEKENKKLNKEISDLRRVQATESVGTSGDDIKDIGGYKFTGKVLEGFPPKDLKPMADDLKKKLGSGVIVLVATDEGKASIVVGVTDDLTDRVNAVELVKIGAAALGGKGGGGRPDMAQAGGPDVAAANDAVSAIEKNLAG